VQGALLFYVAYRATRGARAIDLNGGGCPAPDAVRDERTATYAAIVACLAPRHEADYDGEHLALGRDPLDWAAEAERRVGMLAHWYASSSERGQVRLVDEVMATMRMGAKAAEKYIRYAERVILRRLRFGGLVCAQ